MSKIKVNGAEALPLYRWLNQAAPGILGTQSVKWNFTKFLVARDGLTVRRFAPQDHPATLTMAIEQLLAA